MDTIQLGTLHFGFFFFERTTKKKKSSARSENPDSSIQ
jgi:hypothetical protein